MDRSLVLPARKRRVDVGADTAGTKVMDGVAAAPAEGLVGRDERGRKGDRGRGEGGDFILENGEKGGDERRRLWG